MKRNVLLNGKNCERFLEDKPGLYGVCSNTFQQNFLRFYGFHGRRLGWHSRKLLHQLFESSVHHRLPPIADRYPHPAHLPQSYCRVLFRSGRIHEYHYFTFDVFSLPRTCFVIARQMCGVHLLPLPLYINVRWRFSNCNHVFVVTDAT
ncbi:hypothetical protein TNCV_4155581 [Trichonephila clavipes]|nr:hypothetical protein TNCV_4155581 [Trichonephila clavipes]